LARRTGIPNLNRCAATAGLQTSAKTKKPRTAHCRPGSFGHPGRQWRAGLPDAMFRKT